MKIRHKKADIAFSELVRNRANELLSYDPDTGICTRKHTGDGRRADGEIAGKPDTNRFGHRNLFVSLDGKSYLLHRVIWLMETGVWPDMTDHINGDPTDNRWLNLREVDDAESSKNKPIYKSNKTGIPGVHWQKRSRSWVSRISVPDKRLNVYQGKDFFLACCARKSAELECGYHENHGRRKQNNEN